MPTKHTPLTILACLLLVCLAACDPQSAPLANCKPTPFDELGPFYRPGAPLQAKVGEGYVLSGQVRSVTGCQPLPNSRIEFWLVNPEGQYDDAHRATVYADRQGFYRFESNRPTDYVGRLPHIHMMITAEGHEELITQHYPKADEAEAEFNLVLEPMAAPLHPQSK